MEEKKSFVLYCDYREHLALLTDSERGQLFSAIFDYRIDGVMPTLPPAAQMAFSFIKAQLDKDAEKYAEVVRSRSEAGKKSAATKKQQAPTNADNRQQDNTNTNDFKQRSTGGNKSQQTVTKTNKPQQTSTDINKPQQTVTDGNNSQQGATNSTDNDNDNVNVNENVNVSIISPLPPKGGDGENQNDVYLKRFEEFWAVYPRKIGKDAALKAFKKRRPSEELLLTMLAAIDKQKRSAQWNKDNGQFIPNPATWINQGRWEDELPEPLPNIRSPNSGRQQKGCKNPFINAVINGGGSE